jgi:hypothetical protein
VRNETIQRTLQRQRPSVSAFQFVRFLGRHVAVKHAVARAQAFDFIIDRAPQLRRQGRQIDQFGFSRFDSRHRIGGVRFFTDIRPGVNSQ